MANTKPKLPTRFGSEPEPTQISYRNDPGQPAPTQSQSPQASGDIVPWLYTGAVLLFVALLVWWIQSHSVTKPQTDTSAADDAIHAPSFPGLGIQNTIPVFTVSQINWDNCASTQTNVFRAGQNPIYAVATSQWDYAFLYKGDAPVNPDTPLQHSTNLGTGNCRFIDLQPVSLGPLVTGRYTLVLFEGNQAVGSTTFTIQ
jgi:hypothetical protein